jgi:hypothetical protein
MELASPLRYSTCFRSILRLRLSRTASGQDKEAGLALDQILPCIWPVGGEFDCPN